MSARPFVRSRSIESLRDETFDLVVVGGGVTGAGVVLDAASRGLRAALIERDDFASGTSSKSSKLAHGGLLTDFADNMAMEYRIGARVVQRPDFIEGVRAVIIDKNFDAGWQVFIFILARHAQGGPGAVHGARCPA